MAVDLTPEMTLIGKAFKGNLEQFIDRQRDLNGRAFHPVSLDTAKNRQRGSNRIQRTERSKGIKGRIKGTVGVRATKGEAVGLSFKRLLFTRQLVHGAFLFQPGRDSVKVMTSPTTYPGEDVTYRDIIAYNNQGSSRLNPHIGAKAPKIWPLNEAEVKNMAAYKYAVGLLNSPKTAEKIIGRGYKLKIAVQF